LWGVRLDSGNLVELAPAVRKILNDAGLTEAKIMATGDLNEHKIHELVAARAPIDMFGVGTELATSADAPSLGVVYKLVELESAQSGRRYTFKLSEDKATLPGAKQVFRFPDRDVLGRSCECAGCSQNDRPQAEALLRPVMLHGEIVEPLPDVYQARRHAAESMALLPAPCHSLFESHAWRVELSAELQHLDERVRAGADL
jgi:nicotinate phosphoribosyltransferase